MDKHEVEFRNVVQLARMIGQRKAYGQDREQIHDDLSSAHGEETFFLAWHLSEMI